MAKTRVHELAKEYGVESKFVLEKLKEMVHVKDEDIAKLDELVLKPEGSR